MQIAEEQEALKTRYEHWEEAMELNWQNENASGASTGGV
jgi:hypothetical protein